MIPPVKSFFVIRASIPKRIFWKNTNWNEKSKGSVILKKVCGALVILGGLWLIYTAA
jgi:cytochrome c-type biogenesis protein